LQPNPAHRLPLVVVVAARRRLLQKQAADRVRNLRLVWLAVSLVGAPLA
jgi:hypothetical protein